MRRLVWLENNVVVMIVIIIFFCLLKNTRIDVL